MKNIWFKLIFIILIIVLITNCAQNDALNGSGSGASSQQTDQCPSTYPHDCGDGFCCVLGFPVFCGGYCFESAAVANEECGSQILMCNK